MLTDSRPRCCKLPSLGASALSAKQQSRSGAMLSSGVGEGQKRTTESQLPQSDAGGSRDGTIAKESVARRKETTRIRGAREERNQQQADKSIANSRQVKSIANSRQFKSIANSRRKEASKIWRKMGKIQSLTQ